jgi:protein-tyrosine-phosphatase/DNA-binding transcriptional ArsR family regulator
MSDECHDPYVPDSTTTHRAGRHAALGDPIRLAIADELAVSDRAPIELQAMLDLPSNLLAHHLEVLEHVGLITRHRSSGDGRRRYVHLESGALTELAPGRTIRPGSALFVCTHNSARSQLAASLWRDLAGQPAASAGTHPADRVHPGAVAAARRRGLDISTQRPTSLDTTTALPCLVITVCDRAHEELAPDLDRLHWSIPDPVPAGTRAAFDAARDELEQRIVHLLSTGVAA